MSAVSEAVSNEGEKSWPNHISIRFDNSTKTYYCFYHTTNETCRNLTLTYDSNEQYWSIDAIEHKEIVEVRLNKRFIAEQIPFKEQVRSIVEYLDAYFANKDQQQTTTTAVVQQGISFLPSLRHLSGIRRWFSQNLADEIFPALHSTRPQMSLVNKEQIISVKALAECFYANEIYPNRAVTLPSSTTKPSIRIRSHDRAPLIAEIWLSVTPHETHGFESTNDSLSREKIWKDLAEKFVKSYGGTFECDIGHQYTLDFDLRIWLFVLLYVEFSAHHKDRESMKIPKTRIVFVVDGVTHYVRG